MNTTTKPATKSKKLTASICLYGNREFGFYTLSDTSDGRMFGKGPEQGGKRVDSATLAIWNAQSELEAAGLAGAPVSIHMDLSNGVPMVALAKVGAIPSFGSLKWGTGEVLTVSAEAVIAASA